MATMTETTTSAWTGPPVKLSWSAVFGGVFVALGVWALLYSLGLAFGLSAIDPANPSAVKAVGVGTGLWSLITPLIALFFGGMVAARTAGIIDRTTGAIHGAVLWGMTTIVGLVVLGVALTALVGGLVNLGGKAAGATAAAVQNGAPGLGIDANDVIAPLNDRLRREGKPEVTPEQLKAVVQDVAGSSVRQGGVNHESIARAVAENTQLSPQDGEELAAGLDKKLSAATSAVSAGALKAADETGKAMWAVFGALLLGLLSSMLGATMGVSRRQRRQARIEPPPLTGRTEVYP